MVVDSLNIAACPQSAIFDLWRWDDEGTSVQTPVDPMVTAVCVQCSVLQEFGFK